MLQEQTDKQRKKTESKKQTNKQTNATKVKVAEEEETKKPVKRNHFEVYVPCHYRHRSEPCFIVSSLALTHSVCRF